MNPEIGFRRGGERYQLADPAEPGNDMPMLIRGSTGLGVAPVTVTSDPLVGSHGSMLRNVRLTERDITIPVFLQQDTQPGLDEVRRGMEAFLSPLKPGLNLSVSREGQDYREIGVVYTGGLEGDYGADYHGVWEKRLLEFKATDALWRGVPETISKAVAPGVKPFVSNTIAFFPIILGASTVQGRVTFSVRGDAPTAPVWTITGPGRDLVIREISTGKVFKVDGTITEPITIDMAAGDITSAGSTRGELWSRVSLDSEMIPMSPGTSEWEVSMVGATTASRIDVSYEPRWMVGY